MGLMRWFRCWVMGEEATDKSELLPALEKANPIQESIRLTQDRISTLQKKVDEQKKSLRDAKAKNQTEQAKGIFRIIKLHLNDIEKAYRTLYSLEEQQNQISSARFAEVILQTQKHISKELSALKTQNPDEVHTIQATIDVYNEENRKINDTLAQSSQIGSEAADLDDEIDRFLAEDDPMDSIPIHEDHRSVTNPPRKSQAEVSFNALREMRIMQLVRRTNSDSNVNAGSDTDSVESPEISRHARRTSFSRASPPPQPVTSNQLDDVLARNAVHP